jgi:hypothetical protein
MAYTKTEFKQKKGIIKMGVFIHKHDWCYAFIFKSKLYFKQGFKTEDDAMDAEITHYLTLQNQIKNCSLKKEATNASISEETEKSSQMVLQI